MENTTIDRLIFDKNDSYIVKGIKTNKKETIYCNKVILCCGVWSNDVLKKLNLPTFPLKCVSNIVAYYKPKNSSDADLFETENFPNFLADIETKGIYGFATNKGLIKIGNNEILFPYGNSCHKYLNSKKRYPDDDSIKQFNKYLQLLPFNDKLSLHKFDMCYYCITPDHNFLIDYIPGYNNLFIATGGSGHGFKFAPVIGKLIMDIYNKKVSSNILSKFGWKYRKPKRYWDYGSKNESKL